MEVSIGVGGIISLGAFKTPIKCLSASFGGWYPLKICPKVFESLLKVELALLNYLVAWKHYP